MCDYCAWIEKILHPPTAEASPTICTSVTEEPKKVVKYDRTILVHGSADSVSSRDEINGVLKRIETAATEAYKELAKGCESVDAVELAIRLLESEESSSDLVVTSEESNRSVIRDAAMMDSDLNAGSVGAATRIPHPITLAKMVMQKTDHVLIVENGVDKLAKTEKSKELASDLEEDFFGRKDVDAWSQENIISEIQQKYMRVYGAIARDRGGRLTCGVSTIDDREGSVARSSMSAGGTVLGCGIFADEESCCSVSGEDRAIYVYAPARKIIERLKRERATGRENYEAIRLEEALNDELTDFFEDTGQSCIGAAALSREGEPEVAFKSHYFPWARCSNGVITSGCIREEIFTKDIGELDMPLDCECN